MYEFFSKLSFSTWSSKEKKEKENYCGSGGIRTHASEETGA